jgi:hypothetical protein
MKDYTAIRNDITLLLKQAQIIDNADVSQILDDLLERVEFDVTSKTSAYRGLATPSTNPGVVTEKVFYIAQTSGTYTNFKDAANNSIVISSGFAILSYSNDYWEQTAYTIDLDDYATKDDLALSFIYPFSDYQPAYILEILKECIKDIYILNANPNKTYFISQFNYHHNASNYLTIIVTEEQSGTIVASFSQAAWASSQNYQIVTLQETNSSGITIRMLIDTTNLAVTTFSSSSSMFSLISPKTYSVFSDTFLGSYIKTKGTNINDISVLDGEISLYDSSGNKKTIPTGDGFAGKGMFDGSNDSVDVLITNMKNTDIVVVTPLCSTFNKEDLLCVDVQNNKFTVKRSSTGTSDLEFSWIRIKN